MAIRTRSLSARLALMVSLLLAAGGTMSMLLLTGAWRESAGASSDLDRNALAGHVNAAAGWQAIERGTANTVIGGTTAPPQSLVDRLTEVRRRGDADVTAAREALDRLLAGKDSASLAERSRAWQTQWDGLQAARRRVDSRTIPPGEWFATATANINAEFAVRDAAFAPRTSSERVRYYNTVLRSNVATLAEFAGRERATIGAIIAGGRPIPPERLEALRGYRAIVDHASERVQAIRAYADTPATLQQAIDRYTAEFLGTFESLRQAVYAASAAATPDAPPEYPVNGADWIARSTIGIDSALAISNVVGVLATEAAMETRASARWDIARQLGLAGAMLAVFAFIMLFVRRRVTLPLIEATVSIDTGAQEIAATSRALSEGSQRLAAASHEKTTSVDASFEALRALAQQAGKNATTAQDTSRLAGDAHQQSRRAGDAMSRVVSTMEDIGRANSRVSGILRSIDEIAFQTNLLALNAAVEAARAGEHGQGFAVVANEVSALAKRAAEAARETTAIVDTSVALTGEGLKVVGSAAVEITAIADVAATVSNRVRAIADLSATQAATVAGIERAMARIDELARQDATDAQSSAAASEELNAKAEELTGIVGSLREVVHGTTVPGPGR